MLQFVHGTVNQQLDLKRADATASAVASRNTDNSLVCMPAGIYVLCVLHIVADSAGSGLVAR